MGRCLETLWEPILYDNRQVLRKMGINLFLLGLVVVLGETIVMLYCRHHPIVAFLLGDMPGYVFYPPVLLTYCQSSYTLNNTTVFF
eukprot:m.311961 g.311961  ORF g.311961 m.311961 type:complete len:86 (-) comp20233_c0_seq9:1486-1743(-)